MATTLHAGPLDGAFLLWVRSNDNEFTAAEIASEFFHIDSGKWQDTRATINGKPVHALSLDALDAIWVLRKCVGREMLGSTVAIGEDITYWCSALRLGAAMVAAQRFLPSLTHERTRKTHRAVWEPVFGDRERRIAATLATSMPEACRSIGIASKRRRPDAVTILRQFLALVVDGLVRSAAATPVRANGELPLHDRWILALRDAESQVLGAPAELRALAADIESWKRPVFEEHAAEHRLCLRVEEPASDEDPWRIVHLLQSRTDPSLLIDAESAAARPALHRALLASLGRASRLCSHVERSLRESRSVSWGFELDTADAYEFLTQTAWLLEQDGVGLILPAWWLGKNKAHLGTRARVKRPATSAGLRIDSLLEVNWSIALGDRSLTVRELQQLAELKVPLVRIRGQWVHVDRAELAAALERMRKNGTRRLSVGEIVRMQLEARISVQADGQVGAVLGRLQGRRSYEQLPAPEGLNAQLRPYQQRGYSWLRFLSSTGFGACLADDMGLGKTIQTLSLLLHDWMQDGAQPALLVCPTSVISNWLREAQRFAPHLPVVVHHGNDRVRGAQFARRTAKCALVITSYALLQRDVELFQGIRWRAVVLDEAQNVKNADSKQARAARSLAADYRVALTGTPVENHVGDLWSIMEFLNPGMLGSYASFKRDFLIPIQAMRDPEAAQRLRQLSGPFILRRLKTDPNVIADLPAKNEMNVFCTLTREQGSLYAAVLREYEGNLNDSKGIERRGLILALLSKLKQVCNHPAQFAQDRSPIAGRSGKLARLEEMLEEVLDVGECALVFTQFAQMGELLTQRLADRFAREVLFLHGGVPKRKRDDMVARFGNERGPAIFVLSLKAGGSGLNLTRANHVFHYDRWWNPSVENQATDRAYRIGQTKNVQVHKFVCAGTLEERIDALIERKRSVADQIIGTGEAWLTELSNTQLRELVALSGEAVEDEHP